MIVFPIDRYLAPVSAARPALIDDLSRPVFRRVNVSAVADTTPPPDGVGSRNALWQFRAHVDMLLPTRANKK